MNERSHLLVAKRTHQKVHLLKRSSTSNLHPNASSLQQSSSRGKLSDRGSADSKRDKKKKTSKRSRFHWISLIRDQILRRIDKNKGEVSAKEIVSYVESLKYTPNQNQTQYEDQLDSDQVVKSLKKTQRIKIRVDDVISFLAPVSQESRVSNSLRKHNSTSQANQTSEDPQTARFNDNYISSVSPFIELAASQSMMSSDGRLRSSHGEHPSGEYVTLFDQIFRDNCQNLRVLLKKGNLGTIETRFVLQLLDYGMYNRNNELFCGVKLYDLESSHLLSKLAKTSEVKQFFNYIEGIRVSRCEMDSLSAIINNSVKIVNLSDNNLTDISFLQGCSQIQFLNVNHNQLKSLDPIRSHRHLTEIHSLNNFLQIPLTSHNLQKLEILDLGYNQIINYKCLQILSSIKSLLVLNLMGNPLLEGKSNSKKDLLPLFPWLKTFVYSEVYILSEYSLFKDITFFMNEEKNSKENVANNGTYQ